MTNQGFHLIRLAELSPIRVHNRGENSARIDYDAVHAPSNDSLIDKGSICYRGKTIRGKTDRLFIFAMGAVAGYGSMPESNGKKNWTAILHRKHQGIERGITIDRSEYPDRVRYEADRVRFMIGDLEKEPWILDYDGDKCGAPAADAQQDADKVEALIAAGGALANAAFNLAQRAGEPLTSDWCQSLDKARKTWDAARAQQGGQ